MHSQQYIKIRSSTLLVTATELVG